MLHTSARRLGAAVAATALSAGALVAVSAPAAQAATAATTFTCTFPSLGARDIPVNITATLPAAANAGLDAPAIPVLLDVTLPADVVNAARGLFGATTIGGFSNDMVATLDDLSSSDSAALALQDVRFPQTAVPAANQPLTLRTPNPLATPGVVPATTVPVNLPGKGIYDIQVPTAFKFTATRQGEVVMLADVPCALKIGSPASLGSIALAANESTTKAKPAKQVTKLGTKTKLKVVVDADNEVPTGKVKVMKGQKMLGKGSLNSKGKVTVTLKKALPKGKTIVKVLYRGDDYTQKSRDKKVVIKVG
jgi:Bacterial Ig-like domain (group 3)